MRKMWVLVVGLVIVAAPVAMAAGVLVVTDTTHKGLMTFNGYNGALINSSYLNMNAQGCGNPITALIVSPAEFWVSDKANDQLLRYAVADNSFLGYITGSSSFSSPMGMEVVGGTAYVANASSSKQNVVMLNVAAAVVTGSFKAGSDGLGTPYDVQLYNDPGSKTERLLVDDASTHPVGQDLDIFSLTGTFIRKFHDSTGSGDIRQPQQMSVTSVNTVLAAGSTSAYGVYEYKSNGELLNYWSRTAAVRGVYELGNGNILFTDGSGVHVLDRATGGVTDMYAGISANYIEAWIPEPGSLSLLALAGLIALRRR